MRPLNADAELKNYKPVIRVLNSFLSLNDEALALVDFLKERTFCSTGEALRAITPAAAFSKLEECIACATPLPEFYAQGTREQELYCFIAQNTPISKQSIIEKFGKSITNVLNSLLSQGVLAFDIAVKDATVKMS